MKELKFYDVTFWEDEAYEVQKWDAADMPTSVPALYAAYGKIIAMDCYRGSGAYSGSLEFYFTFASGERMLYRSIYGNWDNGTLLV